MTPEQFWRLTPAEFWWIWECNKPDPVYQGKRFAMRGSEVDGILKDLKAKGLESKWRKRK